MAWLAMPKLDLWCRVPTLGAAPSSWLPTANGVLPTLYADFTTENTTDHYWFNGAFHNFLSWVAGLGGTFARTSNAMMYDSTGKLTYAPNNQNQFSDDQTQAFWTNAGNVNNSATVNTITFGAGDGFRVSNTMAVPAGCTRVIVSAVLSCATGGTILLREGTVGTYFNIVTLTATPTRYYVVITPSGGLVSIDIDNRVALGGDGLAKTINISNVTTSFVTYETTPRTQDQVITGASAYLGPRFDYDPVALTPKGLLLEGARTNLALQSNQFDTTWAPRSANTSVVSGVATSPDGTTNMWRLNEATTNVDIHGITQSIAKAASALAYTFSVYAKAATRTRLYADITDGGGNGATVTFDLAGGQIGIAAALSGVGWSAQSATITSVGNSIYRCTLTATSNTAVGIVPQLIIDKGSGTAAQDFSYAGVVGDGVLIYGAQLEQASFASTYIPTTTASVARAADIMVGIAEVSTGTAFAQCETNDSQAGSVPRVLGASAGSRSYLFSDASKAGIYNGAVALETANASSTGTTRKLASSWDANGRSICLNAGTVATDANTQPVGGSIEFGSDAGSAQFLWGHFIQTAIWPNRATNTELQRLTT